MQHIKNDQKFKSARPLQKNIMELNQGKETKILIKIKKTRLYFILLKKYFFVGII